MQIDCEQTQFTFSEPFYLIITCNEMAIVIVNLIYVFIFIYSQNTCSLTKENISTITIFNFTYVFHIIK